MKQVVSDTFEALEGIATGTVKQAGQQTGKILEEAAATVAGAGDEQGAEGVSSGGQAPAQSKLSQDQIVQKIARADQSRSKLHLQQLEEEIQNLKVKRQQEVTQVREEVFEKAESERKAEKEEEKKQSKVALMIDRLKRKVEAFRGASG